MARKIISLFLVLTAVFVFWFWTKPQISSLNRFVIQKKVLNKALSETRELQELRNKLLSEYNSISSAELVKLYKIIPENAEAIKLMVEITDIAKETGVIVKRFESQKESENKVGIVALPSAHKTLSLVINFSSSYKGFRSFVGDLQKSLRVINIDDISFSVGDGNVYDFRLNAEAYYKK